MNYSFIEETVEFIFALGLFANAVLFVPQAIALYKTKNSAGLSLITFLGFNIIQLFTIFHAYLRDDYILFFGYFAAFISCGAVTVLIILYKDNHRQRKL